MAIKRIAGLFQSAAPYGREVLILGFFGISAYLIDSVIKEISRSVVMLELARQKCDVVKLPELKHTSKAKLKILSE